VANPNKNPGVTKILYNNKAQLIDLLEKLGKSKLENAQEKGS